MYFKEGAFDEYIFPLYLFVNRYCVSFDESFFVTNVLVVVVVFRANDSMRENLELTGLLYAIGVGAGILIDLLGMTL